MEIEFRELPAGTIVKIGGFPLELEKPTSVGTHPENWKHVEKHVPQTSSSRWTQMRSLFNEMDALFDKFGKVMKEL